MKTVLSAAIRAPSGENAQPWRFRVANETIMLLHDSASDQSLYNYKGYGTLTAHGAALENISIAALALGYKPTIDLFPSDDAPEHIANIRLGTKGEPDREIEGLYRAIANRSTNRKPYGKLALKQSSSTHMDQSGRKYLPEVRYERVSDLSDIRKLSRVASTNEEIMLGNRHLHSFFFSHLSWTQEEDARKKIGFYISEKSKKRFYKTYTGS